ncbi:MAG TPA: TetR/AcrR family transcriptional regulator [Solirubrobacteraceae bacterium]|nr:TetR/AcrR family transcriptional regulator [Solirubrobacteraceae bacterium]
MSTGPGLRERKKQQTRRLLADTARRLFAECGFEHVSVAEIARQADVSEATVFNYFPTKEDLVYSGLEAFEDEMLAAVRSRASGESVLEAFGRFVLQARGFLASPDDRAAADLYEISRMIAESPTLLAREQQILARYTDSLTQLIAAETHAAADDPRPAVVAATLIGLHRALIEHVRSQILAGNRDLPQIARSTETAGRKALTLLQTGLDDYGRKRR